MIRPAFAAALLLAALFLLVACEDEPVAFEGGRDPVEKEGVTVAAPIASPVEQERYSEFYAALLRDVRTERHQGFDRVVFEFRDVLPGYHVEYVSLPITACGSALTTSIAGPAFVQVRMTPAAAHDEQGNVTFGTTELTPGLPTILEVESTCDFEGVLTWVLGLSAEVDFRVLELEDPFRLAVDVANPSTLAFPQDDGRY